MTEGSFLFQHFVDRATKINHNLAHTRKIGNVGDGVLDVPRNMYCRGGYHPPLRDALTCRASPLKKQSTGLFFDSARAERFVLFRRLKS